MLSFWVIWILSALLILGAVKLLKMMPGARDFRNVAFALGMIGLVVAAIKPELRWHLLWWTPLSLVIAYFYALRRLFALSHRVNRIDKQGISDPEEIRRILQSRVDEYNQNATDDQKLR